MNPYTVLGWIFVALASLIMIIAVTIVVLFVVGAVRETRKQASRPTAVPEQSPYLRRFSIHDDGSAS